MPPDEQTSSATDAAAAKAADATAQNKATSDTSAAKTADAAINYDTLELKKPEGFTGSDHDLAYVRDIAKRMGISAAQAQQFLDVHAENIKAADAAILQEQQQAKAEHVAALKADPEFGGNKYQESVTKADQFLAKFDPTGELLTILKDNGLDNAPQLVRVFMRAGAAMGEGKFVQAPADKQTEKLNPYPHMTSYFNRS